MRNSWRHFFRRLAVASAVAGATAWSSAMCYAVQLAYDDATDPVYADGWQGSTTDDGTGLPVDPGDNGGFGFEPWDFDTDFIFVVPPGIQAIDDGLKSGTASSSTYNDIGKAWRMALPPGSGLPRAGRGFAPLQVGQTIRVVIDNPTVRRFFSGYFVRFNTRLGLPGGGNICYGGDPCQIGTSALPKLVVQRFEYSDNGQWLIADGDPAPHNADHIPLFDTDTAAAGAQIDLTLTGEDTYQLTIDPFGPAPSHTETGKLATPGDPIDWIEFTFFNGIVTGKNPGDYSDNGPVDAADYTVWRDHLGQTFQLPNEVRFQSEGSVTQADYTAWKRRFGNLPDTDLFIRSIEILGPDPTSGAGTSAPEPSTFVCLVAAGITGLMGFRYRTGLERG